MQHSKVIDTTIKIMSYHKLGYFILILLLTIWQQQNFN